MTPPSDKLPMVCGRSITGDPEFFPQVEYQGRTIYFCTEFCLNAFMNDPDLFYIVHSKKYANPEPCKLAGDAKE